MFGYIKHFPSELKVREVQLYKSFYCGLCKTMGVFSRLTLSYDMVFLALMRTVLTDENFESGTHRCVLKPLKKNRYIKTNKSLSYSAAVSSILTYYKCIDDTRDSRNIFKKLFFRILSVFFVRGKNKANILYPTLEEKIKEPLERLSALEQGNCASIDEVAAAFSEMMKSIASFGLDEFNTNTNSIRIAEHIGLHLGRWLYIIDALDDFESDLKKRRYNAFAVYYGGDKNKFIQDLDTIKYSLTSSLKEIDTAFSFLGNNNSMVSPIVLNIVNLGLCSVQEKILRKYCKSNKSGKNNNKHDKSDNDIEIIEIEIIEIEEFVDDRSI